MIGLKRGTVILCEHENTWEIEAKNTISVLKRILGSVIKDIQHVGSTSIPTIKAKPIIDIAVAVDNFEDILVYQSDLQASGFYYRPNVQTTLRDQLLFACGSYYDGTGDLQTHFIHVVLTNSIGWINYINFRNYLIQNPMVAKEYEDLKVGLAKTAPIDSGREKYLAGKHNFIVYTLRKALVNSYLGKTVTVKIDRPVGSVHPKHPDLIYPVNYGYIPGVIGGDGEELDVYVLGLNEPVNIFTGKIIGIIHRENDVEDKLVAAPEGVIFNQAEIAQAVHFQEQYYITKVDCLRRKSCGAVVVRKEEGKNKYLLLLQKESQTWSFPKGHMEVGEKEIDTAKRELFEEIGLSLDFMPNFRMTVEYPLTDLISKEVVLFLAETNAKPVIREDEIDEYRFVNANEAKKLLYKQYGRIIDIVEKRY